MYNQWGQGLPAPISEERRALKTFTQDFEEGGYTFAIKEDLCSPNIKPFYLGSVTLTEAGNTRVSYRIHSDDSEARILDVIVQPLYQGQDIGKTLVEIAERRFREHGVTKVIGYADPAVHGFWRRLGYKILQNNDILKQL